jgi:hypothetical protein
MVYDILIIGFTISVILGKSTNSPFLQMKLGKSMGIHNPMQRINDLEPN